MAVLGSYGVVLNPSNYGMEESLKNWGPNLPRDSVRNYEPA